MFLPERRGPLPTGSSTPEVCDWEHLGWEAVKGIRLYLFLLLLTAGLLPLARKRPIAPLVEGLAAYFGLSLLIMAGWRRICARGLRKALARARDPSLE